MDTNKDAESPIRIAETQAKYLATVRLLFPPLLYCIYWDKFWPKSRVTAKFPDRFLL